MKKKNNANYLRKYRPKWRERNLEKVRKYGRQWYKKHAKQQKKKQKKLWRERKEKLVALMGGKCENPKCSTPNGYNRCVASLEFHHVNPNDKESRLSHFSKKSIEKLTQLWKEGKIRLLCSNCHRELHFNKNND